MFGGRGKKKNGSDLFHGMLRGVGDGRQPLGASERFPSADAIAANEDLAFDINNTDGKLFLGLVNGTMEQRNGFVTAQGGHLVGVRDDRHGLCVAGNRAGKGRSVLLPNLATWPGSVIVIDPKLDLAVETAAIRSQRLSQRVQVVDPFNASCGACDEFMACGNPLNYRFGDDEDDLIDLATLIADGIVVRSEHGEAHWDESARMFLEAVILHVLTYAKYNDRRTLDTVYELLMTKVEDGEESDTGVKAPSSLAWEMADNEAVGGAVQNGMAAYYDKQDRERSSVLSTLRRHIHFLSYRKIKNVLNDGEIDVRTLHDTPTSLYIGLPATKLRSCAGLPRLFLNLALAAFEASSSRRDFQHQKGRYPCLIVMDEFFSLGRMERIEAAAGQVAGFGVKLLPVLQDLSQIQALYPKPPAPTGPTEPAGVRA